MATITFNQNRKSMLLWLHTENGCPTQCITGKSHRSAIQWLRDNGYIEFRSNIKGYYEWLVTPKGVEWLDVNMPMVDQPQPIDDNDDLPFSDLGKDELSEVALSVEAYDALLFIHRYGRGIISLSTCDELSKLGFVVPLAWRGATQWLVKIHEAGSDYVKSHLLDDEDTKELPAITVDEPKPNYQHGDEVEYLHQADMRLPGLIDSQPYDGVWLIQTATNYVIRHDHRIRKPKPTLSNLIDAALLGATPCQRIDALRTLRNDFDFEYVPSDALEAELTDVIEYMMATDRSKRSLYRYNMAVATPDSVKAYLHAKRDDIIATLVYDALFDVYLRRMNHLVKVAYDS